MANSIQDILNKFEAIYQNEKKPGEWSSLWDNYTEKLSLKEIIILDCFSYQYQIDDDTYYLTDEILKLFQEYPADQFNEGVQTIFELIDHPIGAYCDHLLIDVLVKLRVEAVIPRLEYILRNAESISDREDAALSLIYFEHKEAQEFLIKFVQDPTLKTPISTRIFNTTYSLSLILTPFARETILLVSGGKTYEEVREEEFRSRKFARISPRETPFFMTYQYAQLAGKEGNILPLEFLQWATQHLKENSLEMSALVYAFKREKNPLFKAQLGMLLAALDNKASYNYLKSMLSGPQTCAKTSLFVLFGLVFFENQEVAALVVEFFKHFCKENEHELCLMARDTLSLASKPVAQNVLASLGCTHTKNALA